jgi:hypothetical protein
VKTRIPSPALAGFLLLVALYAGAPIFSVDFHWHLAIGRVIHERGAIPRVDLFSAVEPGRPYVQFNWLWDLVAFLIHEAGGLRAIRVVQALAMAGSFALLYAGLRRVLVRPSACFLVCAFALVLFEDRFRARPDALTLGFLACMLPVLALGARFVTRGVLLGAFALGVLWSNLHGGTSLLLLLSAGALALGTTLNARIAARPEPVARAWALLAASTLGVALSPTLLPGLAHWLAAIGPQITTGNEEWQPTWTMVRNGWAPSFVLIAFGPTLIAIAYAASEVQRVRRLGRAGVDFAQWSIAAGYLVLAHQAVRNAFLCIVPLVFLLQRASESWEARARGRTAAIAAALLIAVTVHDVVFEGYGGPRNLVELIGYDLAPQTYPEEAARFIAQAGLQGPILNDGKWGGYLIWHTWPACSVFVDTRHHLTAEMWPVFLRSHDPLERPAAMEEAFRRWGIELALFSGPTFPLVHAPSQWQLLYKAGEQELFQRRGGAHEQANATRARAALRRLGADPGADGDAAALARAATEAGARRWLAAPYQRRRAARAQRALASDAPVEQARGHRIRGDLLMKAGSYARAAADFERAAALAPPDPRSRYQAALARFALGDIERTRSALAALRDGSALQLSSAERGRLSTLQRVLAGR